MDKPNSISRFLKIICVASFALLQREVSAAEGNGVHIAYLTDCTMYSDWQTVAMVFSYKRSRQPLDSTLTRIMCCTEEERKRYNEQLLSIVETHVAHSFARNERTNDYYAAYNKPGAVVDWLQHVKPKEDWILVLDSDMYLRKPFYPQFFNATRGWCVSADYTYMIGVNNDLAVRHIPEIEPRNDVLAGPRGRRGDQVGGFFFMHRDDLSRVAPLWLKYTEDVREDPEAWRLSGDQYVEKGGKPWISEMYGYAFGAAKANVWHKWDKRTMMYPTYRPTEGIPKLMHYGLLFEVGKNYSFDKHWHYDFDVTKCPPWDLTDPKRRRHGIFPEPPRPSTLKKPQVFSKPSDVVPMEDFLSYYRDLLAIETLATLNAGFCDYHLSHCPPSEQLVSVCKEVFSYYNEAREYIKEAESRYDCQDFHPKCKEWTGEGECDKNIAYMTENCRKSCNRCKAQELYFPETTTKELEEKLAKMAKELQPLSEDPDQQKGATGTAPKTSSPAIIPKHEQPVVVVPRNTEPEKKASPPPSPPPPSPPPPNSPPPESPSPSPSPPPPSQKKATQKQLMIRCYRLALPLDEVKDCVKAAKEGVSYEPKKVTAPANTHSEAHLAVESDSSTTRASVVEPSSTTNTKTERVVSRDLEDLSIAQHADKKAKAPVVDAAAVGFSVRAFLGRLTTWQALLLWVVVLVAILAIVPRVSRLRRRARSGMRTE
ncbi:hypothetical protein Agub_g4863 [Astrephomene gubernaculifera]|uniref:ShKT domain-containing protein n=1 Tax=Astrephomene gubernaculifera TaxID=47775 RepID=A0AAD3DKY5_9CHLO|nr:hypothetical protein Agub_g4863 [Astrephomene gubernaculifera]